MLSGEGKVHRVGTASYNLYIPQSVGVDSRFPWCELPSGVEMQVDVVLPVGAVLISREDLEVDLSKEQRQQIAEILQNE